MASTLIVPGLPSGSCTTKKTTPSNRLNPRAASNLPNNGCDDVVTRTSQGNTSRRCCSLSVSLQAPASHIY